jgi:hypothetical protein
MEGIEVSNKFPVGPETVKKASKTIPGQLAVLLNEVLYSADYRTVLEKGFSDGPMIEHRRWVAEDVVYKGDKPIPSGMAMIFGRDQYFETQELMIAIRDYLEFMSFKEVIP